MHGRSDAGRSDAGNSYLMQEPSDEGRSDGGRSDAGLVNLMHIWQSDACSM